MRVEVLVEDVLDELHVWAKQRAAELGVTYGDVVNRALEAERRRVEGLPRLDPRTKRVGARGARSQMGTGEYLIGELAELIGTDHRAAGKYAAKGLITSLRPTGNGKVAAYGEVDVLIAASCRALTAAGLSWELAEGYVEALRSQWPRVRDLFIVATATRAGLGGAGILAPTAAANTCIVVISLEALAGDLAERRKVAV